MKLLKVFTITITLILAISQIAWAQTPNTVPTYDAVKDWSTQSNPNGVWSYGYLTAWGAPFTLYSWGGTCPQYPGLSFWYISDCSGPPTVAHNDTDKTVCQQTNCLPTAYLGFDVRTQLSVLRWTAPSSGKFLFQVTFVGLDWAGPTSTYVYVLRNSKRLFLKAPITSYQWPLLLHPYAWTLSAGDTIDFIVDWGKDKNWGYDVTGAEVKVWSLGQH